MDPVERHVRIVLTSAADRILAISRSPVMLMRDEDQEPQRRPTIVLVGTLDTKVREYAFLRDRIRARDVDVLLVDAGILSEPLTKPDVTRQEVAAAAGADVQALPTQAIEVRQSR